MLNKALRKEYRTLSVEERQRFHSAMQELKTSGEYDRLANQHSAFANAGGAHAGPAFLPWHREFVKRWNGPTSSQTMIASYAVFNMIKTVLKFFPSHNIRI